MPNYEEEQWHVLYREAILETDGAKVPGRVQSAYAAIIARMAILVSPGLPSDERQEITDALSGLKVMEEKRGSPAQQRAS